MKNDRYYIGVVGQIACGKGELKDYLVNELGFTSFSLSSIVHEELRKKGVQELSRKALQDMGDELRKKYGDAVLAKRAFKKIKSLKSKVKGQDKFIIEGIRNHGEIEYLKKLPNFVLIGVKANRKLRFKRLLQRAKPWDPKTWSDFLVVDRRDLGLDQKKSGQQVRKCLVYCNYILTNNKDIGNFQKKVKKLIEWLIT